jgi:hypothetical protein
MRVNMLNNNKIRLMTQLALYENKEGKEDIQMSKYYKSDYMKYQVFKSIVSATVAYLLILLIAFIYKSEAILEEATTIDYKLIGSYLLGSYIFLVIIYVLISSCLYSYKYEKSRKKLGKYNKLLKELSNIYKGETQ